MTGPKPWPGDLPDANATEIAERRKLIQAAEVDLIKQHRLDRQGVSVNDYLDQATALNQELHKNLMGAANAAIDRVNENAQFIQTVAAALATLYTGALGLSFALATNPVPLRGLIPPIFFAIAMVMVSIYLAYLSEAKGPDRPTLDGANWQENIWRRTTYFTNFARTAINRRRRWLRAGVLALAIGVAFAPVPWIDFGSGPPAAIVSETDRQLAADEPPAPPAGNDEAEALLYAYQLDEYKNAKAKAEKRSPAEVSLPVLGPVTIDVALIILAFIAWGAITLLGGWWVDRAVRRTSMTPDPTLQTLDQQTP